jgi:hypothetical protein
MLLFLLLSLCLGALARSLNSDAAAPASAITSRFVAVQYAAQPQFQVKIGPKAPFKPMPASTPRDRQCAVKGGTADDSAAVMAAIKSCDGGGRVIFEKGTKYTIGKAMDLTKLKKIDLGEFPQRRKHYMGNKRYSYSVNRYPRDYRLHAKQGVLGRQFLQARLPECYFFLPARRNRRQRVWRWHFGRERWRMGRAGKTTYSFCCCGPQGWPNC